MKAIVIPQFGGPDVLQLRDMAEPQPDSGEVLVRVQAAGVNFADIITASGGYPGTPPPPLIAGREYCGTLDGTALDGTSTGDAESDGANGRVMGYAQWG